MENKVQNGFTLIELLVTIAITSILLGVGIPSFTGAIKNSQVSSDYNEMTQALYMARSEAIKSSADVTVCPKSDIDAITCGASNDDWENGWLVFVDTIFATNEASAGINTEDELISVHPQPRSDNTITSIGSVDRTAATAAVRTYIRYNSRGQADWANGSITMCSDDDVKRSRVINIAPTGDVRPGRPSGSDYPRNVFNQEACT